MAVNLLLARRSLGRKTVIVADPAGGTVEPLLAGLMSQVAAVRRVMFPSPGDSLPPDRAPPRALVRRRCADLWHALSADERSRVLLVAAPTAAYLAPVLGPDATTFVAVPDPREAPGWGTWHSVLGAFPELDEIPEGAGSEDERDRWLGRIRTASSDLELVRASDAADLTREVAAAIGLGPKAVARAVAVAAAARTRGRRHRQGPAPWLDEALYSLSRAPEQEPARKRRRRATGPSVPAGETAATEQAPGDVALPCPSANSPGERHST